MKSTLLIIISFLFISNAFPHPGIGIVKDSKGNIYYTDLKQVWKVSGNKKTVVVRNVHTHELYIDSDDNLYGEHLWYNGEALNTWGHYIWCLRQDGSLIRVKDATPGFREDYSFVRDGKENMYWVERCKISRFKKKTPQGEVSVIAEGKFKDVSWMHATKKGRLYFLDFHNLYAIENGKVKLLSEKLNESTAAFAFIGERHNAYGIWTDAADNIYVALHGGQRIKKIQADGSISTLLYSSAPWSPTSGLFDDEGNLWLLEYTITGDCRVRKIDRNELLHAGYASAFMMNDVLPFAVAGACLFVIAMVIKKWRDKKFALPA
ncbi:MAG: hypothetical protein WCF67_05245 [Chitinophagaceae bacterium]